MTQPGGETPGIGGVPGLPHRSGPAFKAWTRMLTSLGVNAPRSLRRATRTRLQLVEMSRRRK